MSSPTDLLGPGLPGRHPVTSELDKPGIRHQGIGTLEIDLPTGRLWFGPVPVAGANGEPGVIGDMAVDVDLTDLWKRGRTRSS